jgi:hypothetical protein
MGSLLILSKNPFLETDIHLANQLISALFSSMWQSSSEFCEYGNKLPSRKWQWLSASKCDHCSLGVKQTDHRKLVQYLPQNNQITRNRRFLFNFSLNLYEYIPVVVYVPSALTLNPTCWPQIVFMALVWFLQQTANCVITPCTLVKIWCASEDGTPLWEPHIQQRLVP